MAEVERDYWAGFSDFVLGETWAGGPSPNLKLVGALADELEPPTREHRTWLACCYAAIYNTSGTAALYRHWPDPSDVIADPDPAGWIEENRPGMPVHSNRRRTHGSPRKMAEGLESLARFSMCDYFEPGDDYDMLWDNVHEVSHVGRYFGIKLAGTLRELGLTEAAQYDIRGNGAKNGRRTLALLYPDEADSLDMKSGGNSRRAVLLAEDRAAEVKSWLEDERGLAVDWFQLEALLCEFNQMVKGNRYAGKTSDADYDVLLKAESHFGAEPFAPVRRARERLLPLELVETSKRERLLPVYRDCGYVWIDGWHDDGATDDPADPAVRSDKTLKQVPITTPWRGD